MGMTVCVGRVDGGEIAPCAKVVYQYLLYPKGLQVLLV
ncbi:hypothetical protein Marme_2424 [Marinomonas mediterranea MMB-1]|jgi:hypothetical protein|uniref:Uncharacterized protein n=1 Tax=Marinomonas mediterranea (strain ATCC 700492 / JCM 21426 / NBRC 103028 / MMB-1) TaxID=717774 RepID=F2JV02_MARM1|nr:hypothetical protein Marme_2424 [Marinomonas mediterranea MMB-1]